MLGGLSDLFEKSLLKACFEATYTDTRNDQTFLVQLAQKNTTLGSVNEPGFSRNNRVEFIIPKSEVKGFEVRNNDRLKVDGLDYSIDTVEALRVGANIVGYTVRANS